MELFEFRLLDRSFRYHNGGQGDVVIAGRTYTDTAITRTKTELPSSRTPDPTLSMTTPADLPIIDEVFRLQTYPTLQIFRTDATLAQRMPIYNGDIRGIEIDITPRESIARITARSIYETTLANDVPTYQYQKQCNWKLYDRNCRVNRARFSASTTISSFTRTQIVVSPFSFTPGFGRYDPNGYFKAGAITVRQASRLITAHSGTTIDITHPFFDIAVGDRVTLVAGCNHDIDTCRLKFNNRLRFGGHPSIPNVDAFRIGLR